MNHKNALEKIQKIVFSLLCCISFSLSAMEGGPVVQPGAPAQPEGAQKIGRRGYKIRCRNGICKLKGRKKYTEIPAKIEELITKLQEAEIAKSPERSVFKFICDEGKCDIKRKGLGRKRGKIRCKNGRCKIKGKRRLKAGRKAQMLEAYRKRLEATQAGKGGAAVTYKLKCSRDKCDIKRKVAGKKWGRGHHGRRYGRRHGGRARHRGRGGRGRGYRRR